MRRQIPARKLDDRHTRETASSRAYQAIRELILRGGLAPGAPVNERALMEQIAIGRTPIREALLRLSAEGLVIFSGQSIHVAPVTIEGASAPCTPRDCMRSGSPGNCGCARLTMIKCLVSPSIFDRAAELAQRDDEEGLVDLDFRFHSQIYQECGNVFLSGHLYNLTGLSFRLWFLANPHERLRIICRTLAVMRPSWRPCGRVMRSVWTEKCRHTSAMPSRA